MKSFGYDIQKATLATSTGTHDRGQPTGSNSTTWKGKDRCRWGHHLFMKTFARFFVLIVAQKGGFGLPLHYNGNVVPGANYVFINTASGDEQRQEY